MTQPIVVTKRQLECQLRIRPAGRAGQSSIAGEVELRNCSDQTLQIVSLLGPLQYLNLIVTDSNGHVISEGHYADRFSPAAQPNKLCLQPGEKYVQNVSFLGNVPKEKRSPGEYTIQAIYEYKTLRAMSSPYQLRYDPESG